MLVKSDLTSTDILACGRLVFVPFYLFGVWYLYRFDSVNEAKLVAETR